MIDYDHFMVDFGKPCLYSSTPLAGWRCRRPAPSVSHWQSLRVRCPVKKRCLSPFRKIAGRISRRDPGSRRAPSVSLQSPGLRPHRHEFGGATPRQAHGRDPLTGKDVTVLWVKGRAATSVPWAFPVSPRLSRQAPAIARAVSRVAQEDEMVDYLPHCTFNLNARAASIDTPLHSLLPFAHVDHVHRMP